MVSPSALEVICLDMLQASPHPENMFLWQLMIGSFINKGWQRGTVMMEGGDWGWGFNFSFLSYSAGTPVGWWGPSTVKYSGHTHSPYPVITSRRTLVCDSTLTSSSRLCIPVAVTPSLKKSELNFFFFFLVREDSGFKRRRKKEGKWKLFSRVWFIATPWIIQSMKFSRPE